MENVVLIGHSAWISNHVAHKANGAQVIQSDVVRHKICSTFDGNWNLQAAQWIAPNMNPMNISNAVGYNKPIP